MLKAMPEEIDWRGKQVVVTIGASQVVGYLREGGSGEGPLRCWVCGGSHRELYGLRWEDREQVIDICPGCLAKIRAGNVDTILSTR